MTYSIYEFKSYKSPKLTRSFVFYSNQLIVTIEKKTFYEWCQPVKEVNCIRRSINFYFTTLK